jgi:hypothetical protein
VSPRRACCSEAFRPKGVKQEFWRGAPRATEAQKTKPERTKTREKQLMQKCGTKKFKKMRDDEKKTTTKCKMQARRSKH